MRGPAAIRLVGHESGTCITCFVRATRPSDRLGARPEQGLAVNVSTKVGGEPCMAPTRNEIALVEEISCRSVGLADPHRVRQHGLKHRLQLTRRRQITLQNLEVAVCCSSDSERSRCAPQLIKQPGVLDGDDGLVGKILNQLDLFISERPNLLR